MSDSADIKRLDDALDTLSEHFDSLLILATRYESEAESGDQGTVFVSRRRGNYFAAYGAAKSWVKRQDREESRKE